MRRDELTDLRAVSSAATCMPPANGVAIGISAAATSTSADIKVATAYNPSFAALAVICGLTAFPPLTMEVYIPSLPSLEHEMHTSATWILSTISVYTVGFSIMQIVLGPVSDVLGRRALLLAGLVTYVISCAGAACTTSVEMLLVPRVTQSFGSACAVILAQAILRDLLDKERRESVMVYFAIVRSCAPLIAPVIGSFLEAAFGWRSSFWFLTASGSGALLGVYLLVPESLLAERRQPSMRCGALVSSLSYLVVQRRFLCWALPEAFGFAGLFVYISTSSYILQQFYGVPVILFGLLYCVTFLGAVAGSSSVHTLRRRCGLSSAATFQLGLALCSGTGLALACFSFSPLAVEPSAASQIFLQTCMVVYAFGRSISMVQAQVQSLEPFPRQAAAAAGLMGSIRSAFVAGVSLAAGQLLEGGRDPRHACRFICLLAISSHALNLLLRPRNTEKQASGLHSASTSKRDSELSEHSEPSTANMLQSAAADLRLSNEAVEELRRAHAHSNADHEGNARHEKAAASTIVTTESRKCDEQGD